MDVRPDVVLVDLRLPGMSGVGVIEQLGLLAPASRVLVLTRSEQNRVVEAIVAGASGYILKTAPPDDRGCRHRNRGRRIGYLLAGWKAARADSRAGHPGHHDES